MTQTLSTPVASLQPWSRRAIISHNDAFGIVRGGRLDVAVLGALQVSERGDLANWLVPKKGLGSPGGALDMAAGAKRLIVITEHTNGDAPKILKECTYLLTVARRVNLIVTDLAVMEVTPGGLVLNEIAPGWSVDAVRELTEATLLVSLRTRPPCHGGDPGPGPYQRPW